MEEDKEIVGRCQQGELEEFGKLYDKYFQKIYSFVYYKTFHRQTAEDLTSQTFFKALEKIDTFNPRQGLFSAWLYKIAQNLTVDYYRLKKNHQPLDWAESLSAQENLEEKSGSQERIKQIEKYLRQLKPEQKEIVLLRVWQGLSYREIAQILDKSEAGCKMTFSRVVRKLRQDLVFLFLAILGLTFK